MKKLKALAVMGLAGVLTASMAASAFAAEGFDAGYYYAKYGDVAAAIGQNGALLEMHYDAFGAAEGRFKSAADEAARGVKAVATTTKCPEFDAAYYLNRYADLQVAIGNNPTLLRQHWDLFGKAEGRIAAAPCVDPYARFASSGGGSSSKKSSSSSSKKKSSSQEYGWVFDPNTGSLILVKLDKNGEPKDYVDQSDKLDKIKPEKIVNAAPTEDDVLTATIVADVGGAVQTALDNAKADIIKVKDGVPVIDFDKLEEVVKASQGADAVVVTILIGEVETTEEFPAPEIPDAEYALSSTNTTVDAELKKLTAKNYVGTDGKLNATKLAADLKAAGVAPGTYPVVLSTDGVAAAAVDVTVVADPTDNDFDFEISDKLEVVVANKTTGIGQFKTKIDPTLTGTTTVIWDVTLEDGSKALTTAFGTGNNVVLNVKDPVGTILVVTATATNGEKSATDSVKVEVVKDITLKGLTAKGKNGDMTIPSEATTETTFDVALNPVNFPVSAISSIDVKFVTLEDQGKFVDTTGLGWTTPTSVSTKLSDGFKLANHATNFAKVGDKVTVHYVVTLNDADSTKIEGDFVIEAVAASNSVKVFSAKGSLKELKDKVDNYELHVTVPAVIDFADVTFGNIENGVQPTSANSSIEPKAISPTIDTDNTKTVYLSKALAKDAKLSFAETASSADKVLVRFYENEGTEFMLTIVPDGKTEVTRADTFVGASIELDSTEIGRLNKPTALKYIEPDNSIIKAGINAALAEAKYELVKADMEDKDLISKIELKNGKIVLTKAEGAGSTPTIKADDEFTIKCTFTYNGDEYEVVDKIGAKDTI